MKNRIYTMKGMLATLLGAFLLGYAVTGCIDEKIIINRTIKHQECLTLLILRLLRMSNWI